MSRATSAKNTDPNKEHRRFMSLASLRTAHTNVLKRYRERGDEEAILAEIDQLMRAGKATGEILDSEDDRWTAQGLLDYWSSVLYRAGYEPPDTTLVEFDPSLAPNLEDNLCPYLGLEAFGTEKQHLFFGRQRLLERLLKHLVTHRLLIVVGSSGSGKSSVVLGGLLPQLATGALPESESWIYYPPLVPGSEPLRTLAKRLKPADAVIDDWLPQQVRAFRQNPAHLVKLVQQLDGRPVVLIIDQFEEVFTLCQDDTARNALVGNLLNFVQSSDTEHRLILTLRTDFESQFVRLSALQSLFETSHIRTMALDANELREAVERPAELVGLKFEEGLVDELLSDVLGEPAALPLLQFTLLKLWDKRERNRVTWEAYQSLGGGRLALAKSADELYNNLIPEEQMTMKRILLKMVRPSEGLEVTSRRIPYKEVYLSGEAKDRVDRVLKKLIHAQLVRLTEGDTLEDAQVEIAHEALIRNWPRLVEWLDEERSNLRHRLRLTFAAQQWAARNKESSMLLRGSLLEEARCYSDLNDLEVKFIQRSRRAKHKRIGIVSISAAIAFLALSILAFLALNRAKIAQDALAEAQNERDFAINETNRLREEEDRRKQLQDENKKLKEALNRYNIQIDENFDSSGPDAQETNASIVGNSEFQKNIRTEPGTNFDVVGELEVGERVSIITSIRNEDNFPWYKIYYPPTNLEGWIAGHLVKVD